MLAAYAKRDKGEEALKIMNGMLEQGLNPDKKLVTHTLKLCCRPNIIDSAVETLFLMESKFGLEPNIYHYNCLLIACAEYKLFSLGKRIHDYLLGKNQKANIIFLAHLITFYGKCGFLDEAIKLFNNTQVSERDMIAWTAMIKIYGSFGKGNEALLLFQQMKEEGLKIESSTLTCVLRACAPSKLVNECLKIFSNMETEYGIKPDLIHCNSIVYVLAKAGHLKEAEDFILNSMKTLQLKPDIITWKSLFTGCGIYLDIARAEIVSQIILCMNPNDTNVFETLLTIYKKSGNTIKEKQLLALMKEKGIKRINL
jgi:pentatricopeptide repeat protein